MTAARAAAFAVVLLLAACGGERPAPAADAPTPRLVTLAPHLAELVAAAGAADYLVGVSAYTDFPPGLADLPVVGDGFRVDGEALLATRPTLVLAWGGGGQARSVALVETLGIDTVGIETRRVGDIAPALRRIGALAGTEDVAERAARAFDAAIASLGYDGERLRVFYQIGDRPLYTVSGAHFISELIARCGGDNVFASLEALAPTVSVEAVVRADPDVILTATDAAAARETWSRWPDLAAVRDGTIIGVPADLVTRPGPRLAAGGRAICDALQAARAGRAGGRSASGGSPVR